MPRLTVSVMALLMVLLTSCGAQARTGDGPTTDPGASDPGAAAPSTLPAGMGSSADDGVFPRSVGHFDGSTTIEAAPTRVVAISTGQLDGLLTLGLVPVGATTARGADLVPDYLTSAFPDSGAALSAMVPVGTRVEPDVEAVAAADPDLILTNSTVDSAVRSQLARIAPVVVTEGTGVKWKQDFLLLADAVGHRQAAERTLGELQQDAAALGGRVAGAPTVSLTSIAPDRVRVFGIASFAGSILADAGLARPPAQAFGDTSKDVSLESLDQADADWIFYGVQGKDQVTTSSVWTALPAVAAGQAIAVDYETWFLNAGPAAARSVVTDLQGSLGS